MQQPPHAENADVRMRGFARRTPVAVAEAWVDRACRPLPPEMTPLAECAGRVLAGDVTSEVDVPGFVRGMMDGYAVRAADILGASLYNRIPLRVIGASLPGRPFDGSVAAGQAVQIMTGAPLPAGADAVLPAECVETSGDGVSAQADVAPGAHAGRIGDDIARGTQVLAAGRVLRPQDVGVLSSIGVAEVAVVRRPCVAIVSTGNELLPAGSRPVGVCIADSNSPMLAAFVARDGGLAEPTGVVPDAPEAILDAMRRAADVVLVSGGSSVGREDFAPTLLTQHGTLAIHGIAMRPAGPTGMGTLDGRLVFLLPGNPVACLAAYDFFAGRAIRLLGSRPARWPYRSVRLPLARRITSAIGRLEYVRVRCVDGQIEPISVGGSSILSSTSRADGFVVVAPDSEGHPAGEEVEVTLYD